MFFKQYLLARRMAYTALQCALLIASPCCAPSAHADTAPAAAATESKPVRLTSIGEKSSADPKVFDFGPVRCGRQITHVFTIRNDGQESVLLERAVTSCDCTSAIFAIDHPMQAPRIAPGETGQVRVTVDTAKLPLGDNALVGGHFEKNISVFVAGEPVHAATILQVRGVVTQGVAFQSSPVNFGNVETRLGATRMLRVTYDRDIYAPGKTTLTSGSDPRIHVEEVATPAGDGKTLAASKDDVITKTYRVVVRPSAPLGTLDGVLVVQGLAQNEKSPAPPAPINTEYFGRIVGEIDVEPDMVTFGAVTGRDEYGRPDAALMSNQRNRWALLMLPSTRIPAERAAFWKNTTVQVDSPFFKASLYDPAKIDKKAAANGATPPTLSARLAPGSYAWVHIVLLPSAPRSRWVTGRVSVRFPNHEVAWLTASGEVE